MPYGGQYNGQYDGYPTYGHVQQQFPQYHPNGMQYGVQQQYPMQQMAQQPSHLGPINSSYHGQHFALSQHAPPQPMPYAPQYSGFPHGQDQRIFNPSQSPSVPYQQYQQLQGNGTDQNHSRGLQQRPAAQQRSQPVQHPPRQQAPFVNQWQSQPNMKPDPDVQRNPQPAMSGRPLTHSVQMQPAGMSQTHVKREIPLAATPMSSQRQAHLPSSPDPLAPSPNPISRQPRPQLPPQATPGVQKPNSSVTPSVHTPSQRIASHVEIPVMSQPTKRRRSNDGSPLPVCEGPNVDYQAALLALSDEYITAAYSMPSVETEDELHSYHRLVAMGIACLESVLTNYRHSDARKEARIRLRLATLLFEETENDTDTEELLSKGIAICERNRLPDLKYAMHHLQTRLTYKNSPKAAIRAADKLVEEVEALRLLHWTYAFRLLRVCFSMQIPGHSETAATLKHLAAISNTAEENQHISLQITVATLEAMIHLKSGAPDADDLAQRAMAAARTHQLGTEMEGMPQIRALLDCLDLSCSLLHFDPKLTRAKMAQMHASMDPATRQSGWSKTGAISIAMLPSTNSELELDTLGIMKVTTDGMATLNLRWMTQNAIYVIGYILSGLTYLHKDEDRKAQSFLREASLVKLTDDFVTCSDKLFQGTKLNSTNKASQTHARSLSDRCKAEDQQNALAITAKLMMIFDYCGHFDWKMARVAIDKTRAGLEERGIGLSKQTARTMLYLDAMCKHAQGNLEAALDIYQSPDLAFDASIKADNIEKDFRVLAALNSIMILRTLGPSSVDKARQLYTAIEPHCLNHSNKSFIAAYYMMRSTSKDSEAAIIKTKQYLSQAVVAARTAANDQILFVVMNAMTDMFFHGIIGEQAEKSAQAARTLAKRSGDKTWICVANSMCGEIKERCGKMGEANAAYKEANEGWHDLPDELQRRLTAHTERTH